MFKVEYGNLLQQTRDKTHVNGILDYLERATFLPYQSIILL